jgi:multidrug resistance efflux pump
MADPIEKKAQALQLNENDDIQQILGRSPGWILQWGTIVVFFFIILLFALGWFIRYPDVVQAPAVIVTSQAPVRVVAPKSGTIAQLMIEEGARVEKGQALAILESAATYTDILDLQRFLQRWADDPDYIFEQPLPMGLQLGPIQPLFANFSQKRNDYQLLAGTTSNAQKIHAIEAQRRALQALNASLESQYQILDKEVAIARENYGRQKELLPTGAASPIEVEAAETNYLAYSRQLEALQTQIINNRIRREELQVQLIDLREGRTLQLTSARLALQEDHQRLQNALTEWQRQHLLQAPIAGQVSMQQLWTPQQFIPAETEVLTILPATTSSVLAKAYLPLQGAGKVETGQTVQLRLDGYPYQEFGVVTGIVGQIAPVPENNQYLITIELPDGLQTTYGQALPFRQELAASARIVTADRRVLERILDRLLSSN